MTNLRTDSWLGRAQALGRELRQGLVSLIYPPICPGCGGLLEPTGRLVCAQCYDKIQACQRASCRRCGMTIGTVSEQTLSEDTPCPACRKEHFSFSGVVRLGEYRDLLRDLVLRAKKEGEWLAELLGELWAEPASERIRAFRPDLVVPIPLYWWKRWQRGYNQSEGLAQGLSRKLHIPCSVHALRRLRNTPSQAGSSHEERLEHVRGVFSTKPGAGLTGKRVLLVDDVLTTGATAQEASRTLKQAGVLDVLVGCCARGGVPI